MTLLNAASRASIENPTLYREQLAETAAAIRAQYPHPLNVVIVLGSAQGDFTQQLEAETVVTIPYQALPHVKTPAVTGHSGKLVLLPYHHQHIAVLCGRAHYYEGHTMAEVAFPIRVMRQLGANTLILTNAAGGIHSREVPFAVGDLMLITDHLNLMGDNPLRGENLDGLGPRFPDMTTVYDWSLRQLAMEVAKEQEILLKQGVYLATAGPCYETPAEIRMMRTLGAQAVGMSTVPEAIAAVHMGMRVLGLSCITNLAAGLTDNRLSHEEVMAAGQASSAKMNRLLKGILESLCQQAEDR